MEKEPQKQLRFVESAFNGEISKDEAQQMIKAYGADQIIAGTRKTKCVWFSLEQMEKIVTLLKAEKLLGMGTDGLRVYFGKYVKNDKVPEDLVGKETVIFVSTKNDNGVHKDYFEHLELPVPMNPENRGELCQPNCEGVEL